MKRLPILQFLLSVAFLAPAPAAQTVLIDPVADTAKVPVPAVDFGPPPNVSANNPVINRTAAEIEWDGLANLTEVRAIPGLETARDEAALKQVLTNHAQDLVARADRLRDFAGRNSGSGKAMEARKQEALLLIQAAQSGDKSIKDRKNATVEALRKDSSVPAEVRALVAGTADFTEVAGIYGTTEDRLMAVEIVATGLITEFPQQPQGYESLLTVAGESDEATGRELAGQLMDLPNTPARFRQAAATLVARYDLVGKALSEILGSEEPPAVSEARQHGKPILIYTWATWSPASVQLAAVLAGHESKKSALLAVNLDRDGAVAQELARGRLVPGIQIYPGPDGPVATRLKADGAPLVYFVDHEGIVRDVRGAEDLARKLEKFGF